MQRMLHNLSIFPHRAQTKELFQRRVPNRTLSTVCLDCLYFLHFAVLPQIAALHSKKEDEYFTMSSDDGEAASLKAIGSLVVRLYSM